MVCLDNNLACVRIHDILGNEASCDTLLQALDSLLSVCKALDLHIRNLASACAAVILADNQILGNVNQTSCQVSGVGCTQSRIGKSLTGAVSGDEVLQYVKTFTEVGLDRKLDGVSCRICHQASHTSQLLDLLIGTTGSGVSHHEDVVVCVKSCQQIMSQLVVSCLPGLNNLFISLLLGNKTAAEVLCNSVNGSLSVCDQLRLAGRHCHIGDRYGHSGSCRVLVANGLNVVQGNRCLGSSVRINNLLKDLL